MASKPPLGKFEKLDVHEYWANEAQDFTPWLAADENIALLGEEIDTSLEVVQSEHPVGPFRADIVCVDTDTGHKVLIENQLEKTNHTHLGQLLTYAAGLNSVTIIWIADKFTEEHRAALDWLNRITDESINFFGCEIELWIIGNSPPAPRFDLVAKPNKWSKPPPPPLLTETQQLYLDYWTAFSEYVATQKTRIRMGKALPQMWLTFAVGRGGFWLSAAISKQKQYMLGQLVIGGEDRLAHFNLLKEKQAEIEEQLGKGLKWRELPDEGKKESHIRRMFQGVNPANKADWPKQHKTMLETLEAMYKLFPPLIKDLDAAEWQPENVEL